MKGTPITLLKSLKQVGRSQESPVVRQEKLMKQERFTQQTT